MRSIRKSEGFTLIELMIVVAIIGILAAIAIPNFLKFQCKAKQSEAKTNLAGIFTAEKAFFGEYNTYSTDLVSVNWFPDGAPLYIYGFTSAGGSTTGISGYDSARKDTMNGGVIGSARYSTLKAHALDGSSLANGNLPTTAAAGSTFLAGAAGDVDTDPSTVTGNSALDTWTMDSSKALTSVLNDCST